MEPTERMKGPTEVNRPGSADEDSGDRKLYAPPAGQAGEMIHGGATTGTVPVDDVVGGSVIMEDWGRMPADQDLVPPMPGANMPQAHDLDAPDAEADEPVGEGTAVEKMSR